MVIINKISALSVVFLLITMVLVVFLAYPTFLDIQRNSEEILLSKGAVVTLDEQNKAINDFKANYKSYESRLGKINQSFINADNPIDFIKFLEKTALDSGNLSLDINVVSSPKQTVYNLPAAAFQINTNGDFTNIMQFIEKIEHGPYLIKTQTLAMKKMVLLDEENSSINVDAQFLINVVTQ